MLHEIKKTLETLKSEVNRITEFLDLPKMKARIEVLETESEKPDFWNDNEHAQKVSKELAHLRENIEKWERIGKSVDESITLAELIKSSETPDEAQELQKQTDSLQAEIEKESIVVFFAGEHDRKDAIVSFHVGTGGVDAQDWAEMLMRMYLRFCEQKGWNIEILDKSMGDEAGIKSATIKVTGQFVYGYLKHEMGVHRLVRLSPFNSKNTRETSFAMVEVIPDLGDEHEAIEIDKKNLKIDVFRASGHGGQGVNTTDSAVRITHIPTGIVVQCQNERSQLQNKEQAMKILKAKLVKLQEEQHAENIDELRGGKQETSWGHQIRSYVLHPYKMVKDHRTGVEKNNIEKVLDGDLDEFIEVALEQL